jgi:hypothetical protein
MPCITSNEQDVINKMAEDAAKRANMRLVSDRLNSSLLERILNGDAIKSRMTNIILLMFNDAMVTAHFNVGFAREFVEHLETRVKGLKDVMSVAVEDEDILNALIDSVYVLMNLNWLSEDVTPNNLVVYDMIINESTFERQVEMGVVIDKLLNIIDDINECSQFPFLKAVVPLHVRNCLDLSAIITQRS